MRLRRGSANGVSTPVGNHNPGIVSPAADAVFFNHSDDQLIRLNLLRALQLHRRLALGCALAGLLLALAYAVLQWPVYTAKSQIYVQPVQPKVMSAGSDQNASINAAAYDAYIQQQVQSAASPAVLSSALKKLGPGAWQRNGESEQASADRLGHAIDASRVGTGYEVAITARASDPSLAAKVANAVAGSIAEKASGEGNAGDPQRIAVLREERDRIQSELQQDYAEQDDLNKQLGMASVGATPPDLIDDQIAKTRDELIKAQTDHDQAEAKFGAMNAGQGDSSAAINAEADDSISADAGMSSMKSSLNQRRAALITQMANLTPQNPGYKLAADELAKINNSLDAMRKDLRADASARIQQKLRTDLERTARVEDQLNAQLRELARTAAGATPKLQRVNDLASDIVRLRNRNAIVDEQLHNLMLEDSAPGAVHVSVQAVPPLHPSLGRILKIALSLALGGLLLGLLAAVVVNKLDPHVYIAADVEDVLGFPPMAVLPDFDEVSDGVAAEHLLRLAAAIEHAGRKDNLQTCIFTGASRRTGVTTITERVKEILSAMGRPAALLDATGDAHLEIPDAENSTALLKQVASRIDLNEASLVLIDTAPLALSAETEYLARSVDGAIVVIESGVTTRAQLLATLNGLQRLETGAVGFVLNRVAMGKADPAFRHSLLDMEKHLRAQGASSSMWPVRWHGFVNEPTPLPEYAAHDNALPAQAESAPDSPDHDVMAQRAVSSVFEFPKAPPEPASRPSPPLHNNAEKPWWLSPPTPDVRPAPAPTCAAATVKAEFPEADSPRVQPPKLPDWFWDQGAGGTGDFTHLASPEPAEPVTELSEAESRIERLRGLFANIGLADLHRNRGPRAQTEQPPAADPHVEPRVDLSSLLSRVHASGTASVSEVVPADETREAATAKSFVAKPEILSPREFVPVKEAKRKLDTPARVPWDDEDIHILPAKRGQYGS